MSGVIGTESLSGEFLVDIGVGLVVGVEAAARVEGVGAADQQPPVVSLGQHPDVVLAVILKKQLELSRLGSFTQKSMIRSVSVIGLTVHEQI